MQVGVAVVNSLLENDIHTVFGIPGKQTLPLNDAISRREGIDFIMARHETAVSHQAWGYAETSGEMAATLVVPGPGDMNAMNGLKNALNDCTPLVHIAVETNPEVRGGDGIHETPPGTYDNVVKQNLLVEVVENTRRVLQRAITTAQTPPKGPVRVGVPKSYVHMDVPLADPNAEPATRRIEPDPDDVKAATEMLTEASKPVIIAGGGIRAAEATTELRDVVERLGAPTVLTYKGKGVLPADHPMYAGVLSGSASQELLEYLAAADVALGIGTDFDAVATRSWEIPMPSNLVHVTLDPTDIGVGYDPEIGMAADARTTLSAILDVLPDSSTNRSEAPERIREATAERIEALYTEEAPFTSVSVLAAVREAIPRDATVAVDAGGFRVWALNAFPAFGPRSYVNPGSWASMGTGLPSGIGAQAANPENDTVVLTGDGGLMMCLHELHTALAEELPLVIVVLSNQDYAIISEEANRMYGLGEGQYGWRDAPINFEQVAQGMGLKGATATDLDELQEHIRRGLSSDLITLVEVPTDPTEPQASQWMTD